MNPETARPRGLHWRQWAILGVIGVALAMQAGLGPMRSSAVLAQTSGDVATYRPAGWLLAISGVISGLMLLLGVVAATTRSPLLRLFGAVVILAALAVAVAVTPTMAGNKLVVTRDGFDDTVGFWWAFKVHSIRFAELSSIRVVSDPPGTGPRTATMICRRRDGGPIEVHLSDNLRAALGLIRMRALVRGVDFRDDRGGRPRPKVDGGG